MLRGSAERDVVVAPGNPGTEGPRIGRASVDVGSIEDVVAVAKNVGADLVIIGPEAPLCAGVIDALEHAGIVAFGPNKSAAQLEGSKAFLKEFAARHAIPTARFDVVRTYEQAEQAIAKRGVPIVVKADGLCAGKGVVVAKTGDEARSAAHAMLEEGVFGDAGRVVVLEDCIVGRELSVHAICDGERYVLLPPARDHKRLLDGDRGPNTGGMGVICPVADVGPELLARIEREIIVPTLHGMRAEGSPFRGVLFAGIMIDEHETPLLLEHNVRFGDPECEALMEVFDCDLAQLLAAAASGDLSAATLAIDRARHAAVVILAAENYPDAPTKGDGIDGIDAAEGFGARVYQAGTARAGAGGALITNGGRVLAVTGSSRTSLEEARRIAYAACDRIRFRGMQLRRDIGGAPLKK